MARVKNQRVEKRGGLGMVRSAFVFGLIGAVTGITGAITGTLAFRSDQKKSAINKETEARQLFYDAADLLGAQFPRADVMSMNFHQQVRLGTQRFEGFDMDARRMEDARRAIERLATLKPNSQEVAFLRFTYLVLMGDIRKAMPFMVALNGSIDPTDTASVYMTMGLLTATAFGKEKEALRYYEKGIALAPDRPEYIYAFAVFLHSKLNENDRAIELLEQGIADHPNYIGLRVCLGHVRYESGDADGAEKALREAIAITDKSAEVYNTFGFVLAHREKHEEAVTNYKKAIALAPRSATYHFNLSLSLRKLNKTLEADREYEYAKKHWDMGIPIEDAGPSPYSNLGDWLPEPGLSLSK